MDIPVPGRATLSDRPLGFFERAGVSSDLLLLSAIRYYFTGLRHQKGHQPDASPMDLEILLLIKFIQASCEEPINLLRKVGVVVIATGNPRFHIAINNTLLVETLVSSRSRINNTLKRLEWEMIQITNSVKYDLLKPLLDRSDVRNWTVRTVPTGSALYQFAEATPEIQFHAEHVDLTVNLHGDVPDPLQTPGGLGEFQ
jgi:hypothetical protein